MAKLVDSKEAESFGTELEEIGRSIRSSFRIAAANSQRSSSVRSGVNGLSTEQRKRLTIAVELVSNPSIIFMDEPTSGLDARAAEIVMRAVKNVAETGRTVVCESKERIAIDQTPAAAYTRHSSSPSSPSSSPPPAPPKVEEGRRTRSDELDPTHMLKGK